MAEGEGVRLQKVLAAAGIGSRRFCEVLIGQGKVRVNGAVITELGTRVDPATAVIEVKGKRVPVAPDVVVLAMNKPRGVLTTMSDDRGRSCVGDYVRDRDERLFHVGRLDADTTGLLLLTNDGDLAHRIQHPSAGVTKTYLATVAAPVPRNVVRRLRDGVDLEDGPVRVDSARIVDIGAQRAVLEIVLHEGRNHIVRRLLAAVGHPVIDLARTRVGPIRLGDLRPGRVRPITGEELGRLYSEVGL